MDTVLITGTTSGIGAAFAVKFARERNDLVLVSRNKAELQRQQSELRSRYQVSVECISCDLAEDGAIELIADKARELGSSVDVLINNAGFNEAGYFTDTRLSEELDMIQVHIKVLTALTKLFLPGMIERGYGRILRPLMLRGPQLRLWMRSAQKCKCCTNSCPAAILPKREYQK